MPGGGAPCPGIAVRREAGRRNGARVLAANEPRAYREVLVEILRELRPNVEILGVEPAEMEAALARLRPDMVICSSATEAVRGTVPVWLELYPDHGARCVVGVDGETSDIEHVQLVDVLSVVDRMVALR